MDRLNAFPFSIRCRAKSGWSFGYGSSNQNASSLLLFDCVKGLKVGASKVSGLVGQTTSATVARTVHLTTPIHPLTIVIAFAGALLGGLIAGAAGGWRAARLSPASALRDLD